MEQQQRRKAPSTHPPRKGRCRKKAEIAKKSTCQSGNKPVGRTERPNDERRTTNDRTEEPTERTCGREEGKGSQTTTRHIVIPSIVCIQHLDIPLQVYEYSVQFDTTRSPLALWLPASP